MKIMMMIMMNQLTKMKEKITKHNPVKRKNCIKLRIKLKEKKVLHLLIQAMNFHLIMLKSKKIIKVKN